MNAPPTLVAVGLVQHPRTPAGEPTWIVTRRPAGVHLAGAWELPGGKVAPAEAPADALSRELSEELGVTVEPPRPLTFSHHRYPQREVLLLFYWTRTTADSPAPRPLAATDLRLVTRGELMALPMPPANAPLIAALAQGLPDALTTP
jgi:8-oxo-dGTP diphosphatase